MIDRIFLASDLLTLAFIDRKNKMNMTIYPHAVLEASGFFKNPSVINRNESIFEFVGMAGPLLIFKEMNVVKLETITIKPN